MSEILLLNSRRKRRSAKRTTKKRTAVKAAKKRRNPSRRRSSSKRLYANSGGMVKMSKRRRRRSITKRRRRNPTRSRVRSIARRAGTRARSLLGGLDIRSALREVPMEMLGMFAAKWAAKRFGQAASETDPSTWNYASYIKGSVGAVVAGMLANMLKPGSGKYVMRGGLSLMGYKLLENEVFVNSPFWTAQFGEGEGEGGYAPGDVETNSVGEPYILGDDGQWYPLQGADDYRALPEGGSEYIMGQDYYGDALVSPGPLGDALVSPGPLGATDLDRAYNRTFLRR